MKMAAEIRLITFRMTVGWPIHGYFLYINDSPGHITVLFHTENSELKPVNLDRYMINEEESLIFGNLLVEPKNMSIY